jgi:lysophospholipase L1-like esterase
VNGIGSSRGNGFRDDVYNLLKADGNGVNMVGRQKAGDFKDPDNEGYPGYEIALINSLGQEAMPMFRPNVVITLVGTNDMCRNVDVAGAPDRLHKLVDDMLNWEWQTMVVVGTLPANKNHECNSRIDEYNDAIKGVVAGFQSQGRWVVLADTRRVVGKDDLLDDTHPNDLASAKMGRLLYEAIRYGESRGWLADVYGPDP